MATKAETKLRKRKVLENVAVPLFMRGTYVWAKFNSSYWPGIIINHKDVQFNEKRDHCIIFWFGDHRISHVSQNVIVHFAINFSKHYKSKKSPLWQKAVEECITHYGYPFTAGMGFNSLIAFARSNGMLNIDHTSNTEDLPEFVKISIHSRELLRKQQLDRSKKLRKIQYYLPHAIEKTCVACLSDLSDNGVAHPLFEANICIQCAKKLQEVLYCVKDGHYEYCFVCGNAKKFQCKNPACEAAFCNFCIKTYWSFTIVTSVPFCVLCTNMVQGLLHVSEEHTLKSAIFITTNETDLLPNEIVLNKFPKINVRSQSDIKVLTLFYGSSMSIEAIFPFPFNILLAIKCNGLYENCDALSYNRINLYEVKKQMNKYLNNTAVRLVSVTTNTPIKKKIVHMHIEDVTRMKCKEIGHISLIIGGTNILKNKLRHFRRNYFVDLFMEFWRIINLFKEEVDTQILWLYEMPCTMDVEEINFITQYLDVKPKIITFRKMYCYVWTNITA